ncbi:hypothetical protein X943_003373 [Babesia divergens]|uniref:Uncharacterized protein n=1 Tax=Babesia divergens TaxID=32595 RepID=A0AAD9G7N8_BABDI|nr:hypothetical protein X943_003373 [Babesia divergens]
MEFGCNITAFLAVVMLLLVQIRDGSAFRNAQEASPSLILLRSTRLYSKSRYSDRIKHSRRQHHFFTKRMEQDSIRDAASLQRLISTQRMIMSNVFGHPLSQRLGDGGVMPNISQSDDRVAYVREYFGIPEGEAGPVSDCCESVARDPQKTHGEFKGQEPLTARPFYEQTEPQEDDIDFNRAAEFKEGMLPMLSELDPHTRAHRFYSGLITDIAFKRLPKKDLDELRYMELNAKQGRFVLSESAKRAAAERKAKKRDGDASPSPDLSYLAELQS